MNEQFTENDLITYTNTLAALIVSSNAPVAEKNNILQRLQAVTDEITKEKISIPECRTFFLFGKFTKNNRALLAANIVSG